MLLARPRHRCTSIMFSGTYVVVIRDRARFPHWQQTSFARTGFLNMTKKGAPSCSMRPHYRPPLIGRLERRKMAGGPVTPAEAGARTIRRLPRLLRAHRLIHPPRLVPGAVLLQGRRRRHEDHLAVRKIGGAVSARRPNSPQNSRVSRPHSTKLPSSTDHSNGASPNSLPSLSTLLIIAMSTVRPPRSYQSNLTKDVAPTLRQG
jgi:hypothetical protein